ncbi:p48 polypeptide of DNA primase [Umbelopsis sp. WA50703]
MLKVETREDADDITMSLEEDPSFFSDNDMTEVDRDMSKVRINQVTPQNTKTNYIDSPLPSKKLSSNFTHREFSFTLASDTYLRYNSYADADDLRNDIERLQPVKIDIGAVYTARPKEKKTISPKAFQPVEKELVFDIDMTDYDEIRTCCSGGDICHKCWGFMTVAIKVIHAALRDDFGFKHLLWVYSGRRGVHCWGGAEMTRKVRLPTLLHPSLTRSLDILRQHFVPLVVEEQGVFNDPGNWNKVLKIVPDQALQAKLNEQWENTEASGISRWDDLRAELEKGEISKKRTTERLNLLPRDIVFQYTYPRLDDKVTTNINHLLKKRVCVPIDPDHCDDFDPFAVPTLQKLCKELDEYHAVNGNTADKRMADYEKTSLKEYVEIFEKFVDGLFKEVLERKRAEASNSMEF